MMSKLSRNMVSKSVSKWRKNLKNKVKRREEISLITELADLYCLKMALKTKTK